MASVKFDKLRKVYGKDVVAVAGLDFEIPDGLFVSLVGPSGCGKSTALRMIAGLEEPTSGRLIFGDQDVTDREPRNRDIAMVFQSYALYPHMTVSENLQYGLKKRGVSSEERSISVKRIAHMLHIETFLDRKPRQLSGGQRQRVALGRALIRDPEVFLLDEPLSNLDAKLRVHMRAELATLHQRLRKTMIYVTHDQLEAMTLSDRIVVMNHGVVQQIGSPAEIYNSPSNRFVAEFMGTPSMNMIPCTLKQENGEPRLIAKNLSIPLSKQVASLASRTEVALGVRSEDFEIGAPGIVGGVDARVLVAELTGAEKYIYLELADAKVIARAPADSPICAGDNVSLSFKPHQMHVFDGRGDEAAALRAA
ncbi:ABC transporter ATP-binding protein [Tardiphaga robiniae]|uniref:ABC transporter ATP-binding protein n=1 Tax=Tardiphaga robiniae TaxID=943830 RepID=UPI0015865F13|nr:sn-glycerol-3-phosphate ABC transporter ATP-binding protein UgpC [Tardiphaga robiniae]NUU42610.1 sn-glycerol-3-phosphate ABC transporter ATP-binding protein UgpC [Tardiphaga robiniae]